MKLADKSKLCYKYRETIGKLPKIDYGDIEQLTWTAKAQILERYLEQEVDCLLAFEEDSEIKRFLMHLEHGYQAKFKKKAFIRYLGLYHYIGPHLTQFPNGKFHVKFTRYCQGHYAVLVSHGFLHSHDPWIKKSIDSECCKEYEIAQGGLTSGPESLVKNNKIDDKRSRN